MNDSHPALVPHAPMMELLAIGKRLHLLGTASVIGIRCILSAIVLVASIGDAAAGALAIFGKKPKSEAQVKRLIDAVKSDPDEKKRRAAIAELRDVDPRANVDVIPCLVAALQKDASAQVRADAAEAMGQFKIVYPLAGLALEAAAELDASRDVRASAQHALWEYHLAGYRSARGANGIAGQTAEPPFARPAAQRPVSPVAAVEMPLPKVVPGSPRPTIGDLPAVAMHPPAPTPKAAPIPSTHVGRPVLNPLAMLRSLVPPALATSTSHIPNATPEPPFAKPRSFAFAPSPRLVLGRSRVAARATDVPFALPPVSEPPMEAAAEAKLTHRVLKPVLAPAEMLAPGPRVRSSRR